MLAATAYETGRIAGQATLLLLRRRRPLPLPAPPWLAPRVARPVRVAIAGAGVIAVVVFGLAGRLGARGRCRQKLDPNRARADMVAGCVELRWRGSAATAAASSTS